MNSRLSDIEYKDAVAKKQFFDEMVSPITGIVADVIVAKGSIAYYEEENEDVTVNYHGGALHMSKVLFLDYFHPLPEPEDAELKYCSLSEFEEGIGDQCCIYDIKNRRFLKTRPFARNSLFEKKTPSLPDYPCFTTDNYGSAWVGLLFPCDYDESTDDDRNKIE